jgi:WhiB family redox-sensing transcriptional regulator
MSDRHWTVDALCAQIGGDMWFPVKGQPSREAKAICAKCPVQEPCPELGLQGEEYGVWGGLGYMQRRGHPRWRPRLEQASDRLDDLVLGMREGAVA